MSNDDIIASIEARIAQLQQARQLMGLMALTVAFGPKRAVASPGSDAPGTKPKRKLSAAARKKIPVAQKKRWAAKKKAAKG